MAKEKKKRNIFRTIWTIIVNTILVFLVLVGILVAVSLIPIRGNYQILAVMSGSMAPTIPVGGLIVVKPESTYNVNDIITFKTSGATRIKDFTTHRLVEIKDKNDKKTFITKGDANKTNDMEMIDPTSVVGKEIFSIAGIGYLLGYIKTLPGLILIVIVPAVIIVYEEVNKIKREAKMMLEQRRKKREAKDNEKKQLEGKRAGKLASKVSKNKKRNSKKRRSK